MYGAVYVDPIHVVLKVCCGILAYGIAYVLVEYNKLSKTVVCIPIHMILVLGL